MEKAKRIILGKIYTSNIEQEWAEAIVIEDNRIIYVGNKKGAEKHLKTNENILELDEDKLVLPGFIDSHMHPIVSGLQYSACRTDGCQSIEEISLTIKEYLSKKPDAPWVFCSGYYDCHFPDSKPHKKYLDELCSDRPLCYMRFDGHCYLLNSVALKIAGITKETPNPHGGKIVLDEDGELTGALFEAAMNLIRPHFPPRTLETLLEGFSVAKEKIIQDGITSFTDAAVKPYLLTAYKELYSNNTGDLPWASLCLAWRDSIGDKVKDPSNKNKSLSEIFELPKSEKLRVNTIKLFVDGVLESHTAFLEEPYCEIQTEEHECCGMQLYKEEELNETVAYLHERGIQVHLHTVGDKAVRIALNAIEYAQKKAGRKLDLRHIVAHNQLINPSDIERFKELGVVANFSPYWAYYDESGPKAEQVLGPERSQRQYPIGDMLKGGAKICFGSDWPIGSYRPLDGIEIVVTRKGLGDNNPKNRALTEQQRITLEEAIRAYTIGSAYAEHREKEIGSLEVGKQADLVILNKDIFKCESWKIHEAQVLLTMIGGKIVYNKLKDFI